MSIPSAPRYNNFYNLVSTRKKKLQLSVSSIDLSDNPLENSQRATSNIKSLSCKKPQLSVSSIDLSDNPLENSQKATSNIKSLSRKKPQLSSIGYDYQINSIAQRQSLPKKRINTNYCSNFIRTALDHTLPADTMKPKSKNSKYINPRAISNISFTNNQMSNQERVLRRFRPISNTKSPYKYNTSVEFNDYPNESVVSNSPATQKRMNAWKVFNNGDIISHSPINDFKCVSISSSNRMDRSNTSAKSPPH